MSDLLSIGKTGLFASKKSLETTGHNIANANTEGYSRQRTHQTTNVPPIMRAGIMMGTGTRVDSVNRVHDEFVEKRLNSNISGQQYFKERTQRLEQIENIFNESDSEGLNQILNRFFNSFRELANSPENEAIRMAVRDNSLLVVNDFHRINSGLGELARNIDLNIEKNVADINSGLQHVAGLNKEIMKLEVVGGEVGDLRDQRDLAIRTLSEFFDISTSIDNRGQFSVSAQNVGTLVSGGEVQELMAGRVSKDLSSAGESGTMEIFFKERPSHPVGDRLKGGIINAMMKNRNEDIQILKDHVDNIAYEFSNTVNAVHRRGHVNRAIPMTEDGRMPASYDARGPTTGIDFFSPPNEKKNAASNLDLSDLVKSDLTNICTALEPNAPGDNRVAVAISKLQHEKLLDEGTSTLEEKYLQSIAHVGLETGKARLDTEQSEGILAQTRSLKERISGVSIDEETANMVRYQHAYDASAKVLKTADDMFKTVLGIMR
ncbi:MAG: flagellar hook-associated protein FlgK [Pseudomonadota bacterium]